MTPQRYVVSSSAGNKNGKKYAVLDRHDRQDGKGMRRIAFHRTFREAQQHAKDLNASEAS